MSIKLHNDKVVSFRLSVRTMPAGGDNGQRDSTGADNSLLIFRLAVPDKNACIFTP